jgi:hypothetical protein
MLVAMWAIFDSDTKWFWIVMITLLIGLVGLLIYMRKQPKDDE